MTQAHPPRHAPETSGVREQASWPMPAHDHPALRGLQVFERGWLSSNNVLVPAAADEAGALLIDTGHVSHAPQTLALVRHALGGRPLARIVNTHLHSDHCGGNVCLQQALGAAVFIPPGQASAVARWDETRLSHHASGQQLQRFVHDGVIEPGCLVQAGGRRFEVLAAPGHDPDSIMLWDAEHGLLLSADALWEQGFGVVFPELTGEPGFAEVGAVLDLIGRLPVQMVVPGHGAPFTDVAGALACARERLRRFQADPAAHARHALRVLIKYHVMEVRELAREALLAWGDDTPLLEALWRRQGRARVASPRAWMEAALDDLLRSGALVLQPRPEGEWVCDAPAGRRAALSPAAPA